MRLLKYFSLLMLVSVFLSCEDKTLDREKEKLFKEAEKIRERIDSTQVMLDSAKKEIDSLRKRYNIDSLKIDSTIKKINPFKK